MKTVVVKVKPGSKKGPSVQPSLTGELLVYVREPAKEGKANQAVGKLIAEYYDVLTSRVELIAGATSRNKLFNITQDV